MATAKKIIREMAEAQEPIMDLYRSMPHPLRRTPRQRMLDDIGTAVAWSLGFLLLLVMLYVCAAAARHGWEAGA